MHIVQQWNSEHIDPPSMPLMPEMKAVYFFDKHRQLIPDSFHHLTLPKPADDVLEKIKDHRRNKRNKRLEALKLDRDNSCCVV